LRHTKATGTQMKNVMEAVIVSHNDMLARVMTMREDEQTIVVCRSVAKWLAVSFQ
jgi:hypothetical protein